MFFIGILTDKNSQNNIKNIMKNKILPESKIIFFNKDNVYNFKNVKFDSIVLNEDVEDESPFIKILENSKYILLNSDIHYRSENIKNIQSNVITYGYNSKATVTISSATDENFMFFIQDNICNANKIESIQEIKFVREKNNVNAYDGMIITIMDLLYSG